ncbi:dienelactone hydrolase family protein [soil metagenome]
MKRILLILAALCMISTRAHAAVKTETIVYQDGDAKLEGFVAYDDAKTGKIPGILVVHQWKGITDHERNVARKLAEEGYIAFCADIYGQGVRPVDSKEAGGQAGKYKGDRTLFKVRLNAGLKRLLEFNQTDSANVGAIGYCFGGTGVLELARSGADLKGVCSFHGGLDFPKDDPPVKYKASVMVQHGADDPSMKKELIDGFMDELKAEKADWTFTYNGNALHSFTEPGTNNPPMQKYNVEADTRSWAAMTAFFKERFALPATTDPNAPGVKG